MMQINQPSRERLNLQILLEIVSMKVASCHKFLIGVLVFGWATTTWAAPTLTIESLTAAGKLVATVTDLTNPGKGKLACTLKIVGTIFEEGASSSDLRNVTLFRLAVSRSDLKSGKNLRLNASDLQGIDTNSQNAPILFLQASLSCPGNPTVISNVDGAFAVCGKGSDLISSRAFLRTLARLLKGRLVNS